MRSFYMIENQDALRDRALQLRNRGITINPHKSWEQMDKAKRDARYRDMDPGTWNRCVAEARAAWRGFRQDAQENYRRVVFPERYEGEILI